MIVKFRRTFYDMDLILGPRGVFLVSFVNEYVDVIIVSDKVLLASMILIIPFWSKMDGLF